MNRFSRLKWAIFVLAAATAFAGCAHRAPRFVEDPAAGLPSRVELARVPFFSQQAYRCGPSSLASAINAAGVAVSSEQLAEEIFTPAKKGSFQPLMVGAARHHGLVPYVIGEFDDLLREVAEGRPVVVLQNLGLKWAPRWHYAVVIGYDRKERDLILRSGTTRRKITGWSLFSRTWRRAGNWGMVVVPPGRLPASADETSYLEAVSALEQIGRHRQAAAAYEAALERWPSSLAAVMGLGNSLYAAGRLDRAEKAFRRATERFPDNGDAFNNLSWVLARQKRYEAAVEAARTAVRLGGPRLPAYRETLEQIRALKETGG